MDEKKSVPATLIVVLSALGLYTASKGRPAGPAPVGPPPAVAPVPFDPTGVVPPADGDVEVLRPLVDAALGEGGAGSARTRADVLGTIDAAPGGRRRIRCLVATIPDPVRTSNSFRFDELLDAIERACETRSYILDRWRFPWSDRGRSSSTTARISPLWPPGAMRLEADRKGESAGTKPAPGEPALLVFRQIGASRIPAAGLPVPADRPSPLLLVFLVTETPTAGLDIRALARGLELSEAIEKRFGDWNARTPWVARILGPTYSGVQPTLERGLLDWLTSRAKLTPWGRQCQVEILSGAASAIDRERLTGVPERGDLGLIGRMEKNDRKLVKSIDFHATVHRGAAIIETVLAHLSGRGIDRVAILNESNTGGGRGVVDLIRKEASKGKDAEKNDLNVDLTYFPYPMHIAEIRRIYERQGLLRAGAAQAVRSAGHLAVEEDGTTATRDVVPDHTRGPTASTENQILTQTLTDIARQGFPCVGIVATDPRDTVFLARLVRQYCPNAEIFTTQAELLFLDPNTISDLRGMLIGSTYPLYAPNQTWSFPFRDKSSSVRVFPSQAAQGVFNAAVAHLAGVEPQDVGATPGLKDYGPPLARGGVADMAPPVWISVVGERGLYPVQARYAGDRAPRRIGLLESDRDYLYQNQSARFLWVPTGFPFDPHAAWLYLFWTGTVACLALAGVSDLNLGIARLDPGARPAGAEGAARWARPILGILGWTRAGSGPGLNLPVAQATVLLAYALIAWPAVMGVVSISIEPTWQAAVRAAAVLVATVPLAYLLAATLAAMAGVPSAGAIRRVAAGLARETATRAAAIIVASVLALLVMLEPEACVAWLSWPGEAVTRWLTAPDLVLDRFLTMERATALTGGVSPMFPVVFLAVGFLAWATTRVRRRHLIDSYAPREVRAPDGDESVDPIAAMKSIQARIEARFRGTPPPDYVEVVALAALLLFDLGVFYHVSPMQRSFEGRPFDLIYRAGFATLYVLLTYRIMKIALAWADIRRLLRLVAQLPMVRAFDRLSPRVSAWFFESPRSGGARRRTILKQAEAVRRMTRREPAFQGTWEAAYGPADWRGLRKAFWRHRRDDRSNDSFDRLLNLLGRRWADSPLGKTHPNTARDAKADEAIASWIPARVREKIAATTACRAGAFQPAPTQPAASPEFAGGNGDGAGRATVAMILEATRPDFADGPAQGPAEGKTADPAAVDARVQLLREWVEMAEDLIALQIVRWIGAAMAQVWTTVAFLVIGSLAMLLAVTSYPFPMQGRLLGVVGLVIAAVVVVVLSVVIGTNTDEVISRVKNTRPGLTPDATMLGHLATYIVPLLGVLAAVSFDMSDLLRSWLDPIFRIFV